MSISFLLLCLALLFTVVSCGETISLFSDAKCTQSLAQPTKIDLPESAKCFGIGSASFINSCVSANSTITLDVRLWSTVGTCTGTPDASYQSKGPSGACNPISIGSGGVSVNCYATVACGTSADDLSAAVADTHDIVQRIAAAASPRNAFAQKRK